LDRDLFFLFFRFSRKSFALDRGRCLQAPSFSFFPTAERHFAPNPQEPPKHPFRSQRLYRLWRFARVRVKLLAFNFIPHPVSLLVVDSAWSPLFGPSCCLHSIPPQDFLARQARDVAIESFPPLSFVFFFLLTTPCSVCEVPLLPY